MQFKLLQWLEIEAPLLVSWELGIIKLPLVKWMRSHLTRVFGFLLIVYYSRNNFV